MIDLTQKYSPAFITAKAQLNEILNAINFNDVVSENKKEIYLTPVEKIRNDSEILISLPCEKSTIIDGKPFIDFDVILLKNDVKYNVNRLNVVVDIFNKIVYNNMDQEYIDSFITNCFYESPNLNNKYYCQTEYLDNPPHIDLIKYVKKYDIDCNLDVNQFDLTLNELYYCIKWIAMKEEINYPLKKINKVHQPLTRYSISDRRASFALYKDVLYAIEDIYKRKHTSFISLKNAEDNLTNGRYPLYFYLIYFNSYCVSEYIDIHQKFVDEDINIYGPSPNTN